MSRITLVRPEGMSFPEWAVQAAYLADAVPYVETPPTEDRWRQWAASFVIAPELLPLNIPGPIAYATWDAWAGAVIAALTVTA